MDVQVPIQAWGAEGSWATAPALIDLSPPTSRAATTLQQSRLPANTPAECAPMALRCVGVSDARPKWLPCGKGHAPTPLAIEVPCNWVCPLQHVMACCPPLPRHEATAHTAALTGGGGRLGRLDGCAGMNGSGQLGDGTTTDRSVPTVVSGSHNFTAILAGGKHTCGVRSDGTALCWGK